jgi:acyl carrier protein
MKQDALESVGKDLRKFIVESFLFGRDSMFSDEDSLLEKGLIDSTGVLEMIAFLKEKFGVTVEESEMIPDNLDSIQNLSAFIQRKQQHPK